MGQKAYHRADVADRLETAIATGDANYTATLMVQGVSSRPQCSGGSRPPCVTDASFTVNDGEQKVYKMGVFNTSMVGDDVVWSLQHDGCGPAEEFCWMPQYLSSSMQPLPEISAPADLKAAKFDEKTNTNPPHGAFDATPPTSSRRYGTCIDSPGPAGGNGSNDAALLYCAETRSHTWLAWKWYKFINQPALQRLGLSVQEKGFMQARVEALHRYRYW
jgi:hypothetical protein